MRSGWPLSCSTACCTAALSPTVPRLNYGLAPAIDPLCPSPPEGTRGYQPEAECRGPRSPGCVRPGDLAPTVSGRDRPARLSRTGQDLAAPPTSRTGTRPGGPDHLAPALAPRRPAGPP